MDINTLYQIFLQCNGVTTDSRHCPQGSLFIALKGDTFNGNAFAAQALKDGCAYAVVDEPAYAPKDDHRYLLTDNCLKTLQELEAIRQKTINELNLRKNREDGIRVVVGLATCGIAAGARPVMAAFVEEINKRQLQNVTVSQTGCIGLCRLEPIVEVYMPGKEKVTYCKVKPEQVARIVSEHIVNGNPVVEYTIGSYE